MEKKRGGMSQPPDPRDNSLFAALPPEDAARLLPHLEPRTWALGDVLYDPDRAPAFLYFPTTAMVSLVYTLATYDHDPELRLPLWGVVSTEDWRARLRPKLVRTVAR